MGLSTVPSSSSLLRLHDPSRKIFAPSAGNRETLPIVRLPNEFLPTWAILDTVEKQYALEKPP